MIDFGTVRPGTTLYIPFATYDSNDPTASVTMTGLATTDIEIYKDGGTTQRGSDNGYTLLDTDGIDFDGVTGIHGFSINLADNSTAGFYSSGSQYFVVVSSITVDAGTISFIAATFRIGYPDAILNTTIATLASQTSFTLTAGPADDNALVGCVVLIHDVASAVQIEMGVVSAYTGSTKTVTLAADPGVFTAAATDNISFYFPINTRWLSGTALTGRDIGASVLLSSGTGTGQVTLTSGRVNADITHIATAAVSTSTAQLGVNAVQAGGTAWGSGAITAASIATDAIDADAVATDAVTEINTAVLSAISGIGTAGGAAINVDTTTDNVLGGITGVTSGTTFLGTQSSGTFASTSNVNAVYHVITGTAAGNTAMDIVYQFLTGSGTNAVQATWVGYVTNTGDTITVSVWRHDTNAWESMTTIAGTATSATIQTKNITLFSRHRGTSTAELGKVYLRLHCTGMTTPVVGTDQIIVSYAVSSRGSYSDGAVWLNTAASNTNTQSYVDGLPENPVSTIAAALTIATNLNLRRIRIANGSSITFAASMANRSLIGKNWTCALGGQAIDGVYIEGAEVSGTGTCTTQAEFTDCHINAGTTVGPSLFSRCGFSGTSGSKVTAGSAGEFILVDCYSEVAGSGTPHFSFPGACGVNIRRWSGGSNIALDNTGTTLTMEVVTGGGQTIDCGGADIEIRGICRSITLTGVTSNTTAQINAVTGPISIAGADGTVNIYGVCGVVTDSRTGTPTLSNKAVSQDNPIGSVTGSVGSVATNGISAASLAADAGTEIATAIWAAENRELTTLSDDVTSINLNNTNIRSVLQDVEGDVLGSVSSIAAGGIAAASFSAGAIDAAAIAAGAIDAATFAADVDAEILSYIVDDATRIDASALNTASGTSIPAILADTGTDGVVVAAASKTGYSLTATTGLGNQTADITGNISGSVGSVTGAVGSVTGAVGSVTGNVGGNVTGSVGSVASGGITAASLASDAGAEIADAVWDESLAGHLSGGSTGASLNAAGSAGDPWTTSIPGAYSAGSAGYILGTNIDATISSRLASASYTAPPAASAVADAIWDESRAGHTSAGTFGEGVASVQGNVTGSTASVTGAVGSVTGNIGGNVTGSVGSVATNGISAASLAADAGTEIATAVWASADRQLTALDEDVTTIDLNATAVGSVTGAVGSVTGNVGGNVTGSVGSVTGAVGSVTGNVGGNVTGSVGSVAAGGITASSLAADAGAEIADAVWDEAIAGHLSGGSTGAALNGAGSAGDPWTTSIPGAYGSGTAGYILGTNLDATVSSRLASASYSAAPSAATVADAIWDEERAGHTSTGTFGHGVASVQGDVTGSVASVTGAVGSVTGNVGGNITGSVASVLGTVGSVTGSVGGNVTGSVGSVVGAVGSVTGNVGGNVTGSVGSVAANGITAASIAAGAIDADALNADASTEIATAVWAAADRQLTALDEDVTTIDLNNTAVGSVVGAVGSVTGNVGGNVTGSVGSVTGAVGSVTGNVTGSVGSIAAGGIAAASFAAGAIDATAIAANAIGASELAADAVAEIAAAVGSPNRVTKNTALSGFTFVMQDTAGDPTTGLTVTAQRSIDGGALGACTNSASEVGSGIYKIDLAAADLNGTTIMLVFSAAGAKTTFIEIVTQPASA